VFVRGAQTFQKSCGHFKILVAWRVTRNNLNTVGTQMLVARVQNLVARDLCTLGIWFI